MGRGGKGKRREGEGEGKGEACPTNEKTVSATLIGHVQNYFTIIALAVIDIKL